MKLNPEQQEKLRLIRDDLEYYAENILRIKDKQGQIVPLSLNRAQKYIHDQVEKQKIKTGKVRAIVVKSRQQGASTYIGARFYQKTSKQRGKNTFILSHESKSTDALFKMPKRFYDNEPVQLQLPLKASNANELIFDGRDSQYGVGTAGSADVGRGGTNQFFHGSEVGFWKNADSLATGIMQSVADMPGTEIFLESTANGIGTYFHNMAMKALKGESEFILIFIPWHWSDEYEMTPASDFKLTSEELELAGLYLDEYTKQQQIRKMAWRRNKINSAFEGKAWKFQQEYPFDVHEAFVTSGESLIPAQDIVRARKSKIKDKEAPLVMGVDPARGGGDRTAITFRRGREMPAYYTYKEMKPMRLAGILAKYIDMHDPQMVNVDVAEGFGTVDRLHEMGYKNVNAVHFNEKAIEAEVYANKRAEMWCNARDWLKGEVNIPDDDDLHGDLACVPDYLERSDGKIRLVSKDKIKEEYGKSPDIGDSVVLTFAYPVRGKTRKVRSQRVRQAGKNQAKWKHTQGKRN